MIVHALHPAPILRIPARMRKPRFDWLSIVTPIEMREASGTDAPLVDDLVLEDRLNEGELVPREFEGRLYAPMRFKGRLATVPDLVAALEGAPREGAGDPEWLKVVATFLLADTPLTVPYRGQPRDIIGSGDDDRGGELGPHRHVLRDGTAAASEAMRELAEEDLLIVDGVAHRRVLPLARIHSDALCARVYLMLHQRMTTIGATPTPPQAFEATLAAVALPGADGFRKPKGFDAWMRLPAGVFGERPARMVANRLPALMRSQLDQRMLVAPDGVRERLVEMEGEGMLGLVRGASIAPVLAECASFLQAMSTYVPEGWTSTGWCLTGGGVESLAALRDVLVPAYAARDPESLEEDAPAFASI